MVSARRCAGERDSIRSRRSPLPECSFRPSRAQRAAKLLLPKPYFFEVAVLTVFGPFIGLICGWEVAESAVLSVLVRITPSSRSLHSNSPKQNRSRGNLSRLNPGRPTRVSGRIRLAEIGLADCNRGRRSCAIVLPGPGACPGELFRLIKAAAIFDQILEQFSHFACMLLIASPLIDPGRVPRGHT
jgi:hypothetical protein